MVFKKTETIFEATLNTAKSGFPSLFKSPVDKDCGLVPVVKSVFAENEGVELPVGVVLSKIETEFEPAFPAKMSGFPSPFTSLNDIDLGVVPIAKSVLAVKVGVNAPGVVVLNKTEAVLVIELPDTKSGFPSPFRSQSPTVRVVFPTVKSVFEVNDGVLEPGVVVFINTEIAVPDEATAKSGLPSPFKSAIDTTKEIRLVVDKSTFAEKLGGYPPGVVVFKKTDILAKPLEPATKSGLPSPLKSPVNID